jgi:hypothetical protein
VTGYGLDYRYVGLIPNKSKSHLSIQWVLGPLFTEVKVEASSHLIYIIIKMVLEA